MLNLMQTKRTDLRLLESMKVHYSHPKGFVGRNICYGVYWDGVYYGHIVGGSSTLFLPGRNEFFGGNFRPNSIINNIYYHIEKSNGAYPKRNFSSFVLMNFRIRISEDWKNKYGDDVIGFESLVELPRSGELYIKDGWTEVGITKGYTCKRVGGKGTDTWSGKRVWNTSDLRPKRVFCRKND